MVGGFLLGPVCAAFARRYPRARIKLQVMVSLEVMRRVESMSIDFGLIESPCNRPALIVEEVGEDELVIIAAPDHPLAAAKDVSLADLRAADWCLGEADSFTRQMITLGLRQGGLSIVLETNAPTAIKSAVRAGMGLGCLSRATVAAELASGDLVSLAVEGLQLHRIFSLISPKGVYRGALEQGFVDSIHEALGERPSLARAQSG